MAEWVQIGTADMQAAQDALGLSNERLAPRLFITSKTWERWKSRGAIPRRELERVAGVLNLRVETPDFDPDPIVLERDELEEMVGRLEAVAARFEKALGAVELPPRAGKAPR